MINFLIWQVWQIDILIRETPKMEPSDPSDQIRENKYFS